MFFLSTVQVHFDVHHQTLHVYANPPFQGHIKLHSRLSSVCTASLVVASTFMQRLCPLKDHDLPKVQNETPVQFQQGDYIKPLYGKYFEWRFSRSFTYFCIPTPLSSLSSFFPISPLRFCLKSQKRSLLFNLLHSCVSLFNPPEATHVVSPISLYSILVRYTDDSNLEMLNKRLCINEHCNLHWIIDQYFRGNYAPFWYIKLYLVLLCISCYLPTNIIYRSLMTHMIIKNKSGIDYQPNHTPCIISLHINKWDRFTWGHWNIVMIIILDDWHLFANMTQRRVDKLAAVMNHRRVSKLLI